MIFLEYRGGVKRTEINTEFYKTSNIEPAFK